MGEAKRRKEYLKHNPEVTPRPKVSRPEPVEDSGTQVARPAVQSLKRAVKFTADLLSELRSKRAQVAPHKPRKELTEDELKALKGWRNRRRKAKQKAVKLAKTVGSKLGNKKPTTNTCRRRRLAEKHPERP
jgi:hypothetical protein